MSSIAKNSFPSDVILNFENGLSIQGLTELSSNNQYVGKYKLYDLGNERFYIEENNKTTYLTKEDIDKSCSHSEEIRDNPILFFDFKKDLSRHDLDIEQLSNGILFSKMSLANRKILFDNLKKEDTFFLKTLKDSKILDNVDNVTTSILEDNNFSNVVKIIEILKKHNIEEPILHNKLFMSCCEPENFENLITFDTNLLIKVINDSNLINIDLNNKDITPEYDLTNYILVENTLSNFLYYVKKYNIKDRYLIDKSFISICDNPLAEDFFKNYDANTKILLNASKITDNHVSARQNLNDLLTLLKITGALEDDPIIKQKATTFITEKMFSKELPNGEKNKFLLIGNDIHSVFNFNYLNSGFDKEFSEFFLKNYQELVATEKRKAGFIQRVYLNFKQISKTSTSDKGSQRKLKVTIEKCKNYLSTVKFDNVSAKDRDFAELIGEWFDDNTVWLNAKKYMKNQKKHREIFLLK